MERFCTGGRPRWKPGPRAIECPKPITLASQDPPFRSQSFRRQFQNQPYPLPTLAQPDLREKVRTLQLGRRNFDALESLTMRFANVVVYGLTLTMLLAGPASAEKSEVSTAISQLCSANVPTMVSAGKSLCALEERAIPGLISLLKTDQIIVPTSPLGAPGSVMYAGHGGPGACFPYVFYGLNETQVRAGWILERITFQDFGFGSQWDGDRRTPAERHAAAIRAKQWWSSQGPSWKRVLGLEDALRSDSPTLQKDALRFLCNQDRDGNCSSLNETTYFAQVHPAVQSLFDSEKPHIREAAAAIWARAERNKSHNKRELFLDGSRPSAAVHDIYLLQDDALVLNGQILARVGDPLSLLQGKAPCKELLGRPRLETIPPLFVEVTNGRIASWETFSGGERPPWAK